MMTIGTKQLQLVKITKILLCALIFLLNSVITFAQETNFKFQQLLEKRSDIPTPFAIPNNHNLSKLLADKSITVKNITKDWIFIQATPNWIIQAKKNKLISSFYLEFPSSKPLNDSSALKHFVRPVQLGQGGLQTPFTGKNILVGFVDNGIDYTHPDFIDANGNTRVLYYWDQSLPYDAVRTPQPYGYGQVWTAADIQSGNCGSIESGGGHGSTVSGTAVGNGLANGQEKGMAPDAKIIMVQTDFTVPNWTLTVADACDFLFKKADELGIPAVMNLSVGSYLGSHDATDPAAVLMDSLVEAKNGRIIVCAAGNSGNWGKYHIKNFVNSDTSFVWVEPNPASQLGAYSVYMDVWADTSVADWNYAWGANLNSGTFEERSSTLFKSPFASIGSTVKDTLWNGPNRIAILETFSEIIGPNVHLEFYFSTVDSISYLYSFKTTGSGLYDGWSGSTSMALNDFKQSGLPDALTYPPIQHYVFPDSLSTMVSSWACSSKIVTVGNTRNRQTHIDKNGNTYVTPPTNNPPPGKLVPSSAKGPTKNGLIKPDIVASGDLSLSAAPMSILSNPAFNSSIDIDGWHARNGGTSMASPVVAGIAALYLEKCSKGNYLSFINAMKSTAYTDAYTGAVPNNGYGSGKIHALNLLLQSNFTAQVNSSSTFCPGDSAVSNVSISPYTIQWMNNDTTPKTALTNSEDVYFLAYDQNGCVSYSDTVSVTALSAPPAPIIYANGNLLSTDPYPNLQWYENGAPIMGATTTSYSITLPSTSDFTVSRTSTDGCEVFSLPYNPSLSISDNQPIEFSLYPNPTTGLFEIICPFDIQSIEAFDNQGRKVKLVQLNQLQYSLEGVENGTYLLQIFTQNKYFPIKIVKN